MGKFDKKVSKAEPDAPHSQKLAKKKSNAGLAKLEHNPKGEKERNMKILNFMQRSDEVKSHSKAEAHFNEDKMVNKLKKKEDKFKRRNK